MFNIAVRERRNLLIKSTPSTDGELDSDHPPPEELPQAQSARPSASLSDFPLSNEGSNRGIQSALWFDWRWQLRNRIRTPEDLCACFPQLANGGYIAEASARFPLALTPYYASLIQTPDASDPIFQMAIPQLAELTDRSFLIEDPLAEDHDMPVPGLIHRYRDRALLIATSTCSVYCRHCTRKRVAGFREGVIGPEELDQAVRYLGEHPEIRDVIVSGGDPLTLGTETLERILARLREVESVEVIRIGTRAPVVLPMRITTELVQMLRRYHPLYINTHFNHPAELTAEAAEACRRMADAGIPLGNQTVLLRGVNDSPQVLETLFRGLLRNRVRPYYLFQCDLVRGVEHFRTPISRGIEIMEYLRGRVSGMAIPTFVVDAPNGGGKIPLLPNYLVSMSPTHTVLRNFEGMLVSYPEPTGSAPDWYGQEPPQVGAGGVWEVASGRLSHLQPAGSEREQRQQSTHQAVIQEGRRDPHPSGLQYRSAD